MFFRLQQTCPNTLITVAISTAGNNNSISHKIFADQTQQLIRHWIFFLGGRRLILGQKRRFLFLPNSIRLSINGGNGIYSTVGQHDSLSVRIIYLHHETARNSCAFLNPLRSFETSILRIRWAVSDVMSGFSTAKARVVWWGWTGKLFCIMDGVIFMVGLRHHCFNFVFL